MYSLYSLPRSLSAAISFNRFSPLLRSACSFSCSLRSSLASLANFMNSLNLSLRVSRLVIQLELMLSASALTAISVSSKSVLALPIPSAKSFHASDSLFNLPSVSSNSGAITLKASFTPNPAIARTPAVPAVSPNWVASMGILFKMAEKPP